MESGACWVCLIASYNQGHSTNSSFNDSSKGRAVLASYNSWFVHYEVRLLLYSTTTGHEYSFFFWYATCPSVFLGVSLARLGPSSLQRGSLACYQWHPPCSPFSSRSGVNVEDSCPFSNEASESINHALLLCQVVVFFPGMFDGAWRQHDREYVAAFFCSWWPSHDRCVY